jgi:hypothetical protein
MVHGLAVTVSLAACFLFAMVSLALGDSSKVCENEALRATMRSTALPDCRAYEMVTPPYKQGYPLSLFPEGSSFAANGETAVITGIATIAGNPGSGELVSNGSVYLASRTEAGWQLLPLNPPLSQFVGQVPVAFEADNGSSLWILHTPAQPASARGLYVRSRTGVFQFIGRLNPIEVPEAEAEPSNIMDQNAFTRMRPVGATGDYQHVVMETVDPRGKWPFDETLVTEKQHSLYEYSGTGNDQPVLVAVEGSKADTDLIAKCGVELGSSSSGGSIYNALSRDGESIFFTVHPCSPGPSTNEVYARLNGAVTSAASAKTVHVSASECTVSCGVAESGKNFEGASEDGGLVYFTSTQKLTNNAVDGATSGDAHQGCASTKSGEGGCNLYLYDFSEAPGERLTTVSVGGEVLGVVGIAEDGSRIYYVSRQNIASAGENVYAKHPTGGEPNLYVYDAASGKNTFIATLGEGDSANWSRVNTRTAEVGGTNGQFLLFASPMKGLTPDDVGKTEVVQLFEYKAPGEGNGEGTEPAELVRVTKGENGFNQDGNDVGGGVPLATIESVAGKTGFGSDFKSSANTLNMSVDGKTVFFITLGELSPRATSAQPTLAQPQGCRSLYEFHTDGALSEGSVHLISDGQDTQLFKGAFCGPQFQGIDRSGSNVLFTASDALLPSDVDGVQRDIYDARIDGGFGPAISAGSCGAGLCESSSSRPSPQPLVGSATENQEGRPAVSPVIPKKAPKHITKKQRKARQRHVARLCNQRRQKTECKRRPAHSFANGQFRGA